MRWRVGIKYVGNPGLACVTELIRQVDSRVPNETASELRTRP